MKKTILSTLVSAALVAAAAAPAFAQAGSPGGEGQQARHHAQRQHEGQRAHQLPSERIEARLAYLKTALKITDAQQAQWNSFADTLRKHAGEGDKQLQSLRSEVAAQREKGTQPTAIERMERRQLRLAAAHTRLAETLAAARPLYAALSPEQQKIADDLLTPRRQAGARHGGRPRA